MVRELKHTEIGDIPVDWEVQTFEETFKILSNNTLSRENLNNRGGAVRNIHYGDVLTQFSEVLKCSEEEIPYINDLSLLSSSTQLLQDGDLIIADTAEDETVGKVTEVQGLGDGKLVAGLHTIPCRVKKGDFAPGWLGYYMNSHMYHDQIIPFITGIKVSSISKSAIAETLILVPPRNEQEAIINCLSDMDNLIRGIRCLKEKKRLIYSGVFNSLLNGKRFSCSDFSGDWNIQCMDEYVDFQVGYPFDSSYFNIKGNGLRVIKNRDLKSDDQVYYTTEQCMDSYIVNNGDVLVGMDGDFIPCLWTKGKALLNQRVGRILCKTTIQPEFAYFAFNKPLWELQNGTGATTVKHLSHGDIKKLKVLMPPTRSEQKAVSDILLDLEKEIDILSINESKNISIKLGMLSDLISGKIRLI